MGHRQQIIFIICLIIFFVPILYFFWPFLNDDSKKKEDIYVTVSLDNRCSFMNEVFIVKHSSSGRTAKFSNSIANITVPEGTTLTLALSPLYPNFRYDGVPQKVQPNMTMVADCSSSPRMEMIMDSMNKSFGKK